MMRRPHKENSQALAEANYRSLRRLFPGIAELGCWQCYFRVARQELEVTVLEQTPYTTALKISLRVENQPYMPPSVFTIRMYHDAVVAEVSNFQGHRQLRPFYTYPNEQLYYADEKRQVNRLLWEALMFCEKHGLEVKSIPDQIAI